MQSRRGTSVVTALVAAMVIISGILIGVVFVDNTPFNMFVPTSSTASTSTSTSTQSMGSMGSTSGSTTSSTVSTISQVTVSTSTASCSSCIVFDQNKLSAAVSYFTSRYNSQIGLITVGPPSDSNTGGVTFYYMNDGTTACTPSPANARVIPNENLKDAYAFLGIGTQTSIANTIIQSVTTLYSTDTWHPSWNDESMIGIPDPYSKANNNYCLTPNYGAPSTITINGQSVTVVQALPWSVSTQTWVSPDMNVNDASNCSAIDECLFQAVNLYIRGDLPGAESNLQTIASQCTVNTDGSEEFGTGTSRGMYLGTFLETYEIINNPSIRLSGGCTISGLVSTVYCLQLSDGGIAMNYSSCSTHAGDDDETTNAFLLAASPGVITRIQSEYSNHQYSVTYIPPNQPSLAW